VPIAKCGAKVQQIFETAKKNAPFAISHLNCYLCTFQQIMNFELIFSTLPNFSTTNMLIIRGK